MSNSGGCPVGSPFAMPAGGLAPSTYGGVRAMLAEYLRSAGNPRPLTVDDFEWVFPEIAVELAVGASSGSSALYQVTSEWKLLIYGISGIIAMTDYEHEPLDMNAGDDSGGFGDFATNPLSIRDRIAIKSMNAQIELKNTDLKRSMMPEGVLTMCGITPPLGSARFFPGFHVVRQGHNLQLSVSMRGTDSKVLGGATRYGVQLHALQLKTAE